MALDATNTLRIDGLIISKTAVPSVSYVGNPIYYTITVQNTTQDTISNLTLIDTYSNSALLTFCSSTNFEPEYDGHTVAWNILNIPPQTEERLNILIVPDEEGPLRNNVEVFLDNISSGGVEVFTTVLDLNSQLSSLESKLSTLEENIEKLTSSQKLALSNIEAEILGSIPSLVSGINEKIDLLLPKNVANLSTGPIIRDANAKSLVIFFSNNNPFDATVRVMIRSPLTKGENDKFIDVSIKGGNYYLSILPCPPPLFEVVYLDVIKGISIFTATRRNVMQDSYQSSVLIASNTILNNELTQI